MLEESLKGIVVLDFGQLIAAPVCGMWLGDLGATVIKVEPIGGELARHLGPPSKGGESMVSLASNRNKLGLSVDLKHATARSLMARASRRADVIIQNFRPGVAERLGIGYDDMSRANPELIYCAISAFGQSGEWASVPGVDGIIQAASGLMSTIAGAGGPGKVPLPLADMTGAMFSVISILAALRRRDHGHGGSLVDVDLFSGMMMLQHINLAAYLTTGEVPGPTGSEASYAAPNEAFPTSDGWIMVAAYQPARWQALCEQLGVPAIVADHRFATNAARVANRSALHDVLDPVFRRLPSLEWQSRLNKADIMAMPVAQFDMVTKLPAYKAEHIEIATRHPTAGEVRMPRFAFGGRTNATAAPGTGQHGREALSVLGFSQPEIEKFIADGVVVEGTAG